MSLELLNTLLLGNGRFFCSFRIDARVRVLVKLYKDVAEFNFLVEYLKLMQVVENKSTSYNKCSESVICVPLHALSWPPVESQGDGRQYFIDIFYQLTTDVLKQIEIDFFKNGPRLFIPFTIQRGSFSSENRPMENQGIIMAYTAPHHLSLGLLGANVIRAVMKKMPNQRSSSSPPNLNHQIPFKNENSISESFSLDKNSTTDTFTEWFPQQAIFDVNPSRNFHSRHSVRTISDYMEQPVGQFYHIGQPQYTNIDTFSKELPQEVFFENYDDDNDDDCEDSITPINTTEMQPKDNIKELKNAFSKVLQDLKIEKCSPIQTPIQKDLFTSTNQIESHNSINLQPHRSSLSIKSHKLTLKDLIKFAQRIALSNGAIGDEVPLPTASMHFNISPVSLKQYDANNSPAESSRVQIAQNQSGSQQKTIDGLQLTTYTSGANGLENIELVADLDLGLFLHKWLSKIGKIDPEKIDNPGYKRDSLLRSIKERYSDSSRRTNDSEHFLGSISNEEPNQFIPQHESSRLSKTMSQIFYHDDMSSFQETEFGNRDRGMSECLRPWIHTKHEAELGLPDKLNFVNSIETLPDMLRKISEGTHDICIQSVDLLSSGSTLSMQLSSNAPGGENASNKCVDGYFEGTYSLPINQYNVGDSHLDLPEDDNPQVKSFQVSCFNASSHKLSTIQAVGDVENVSLATENNYECATTNFSLCNIVSRDSCEDLSIPKPLPASLKEQIIVPPWINDLDDNLTPQMKSEFLNFGSLDSLVSFQFINIVGRVENGEFENSQKNFPTCKPSKGQVVPTRLARLTSWENHQIRQCSSVNEPKKLPKSPDEDLIKLKTSTVKKDKFTQKKYVKKISCSNSPTKSTTGNRRILNLTDIFSRIFGTTDMCLFRLQKKKAQHNVTPLVDSIKVLDDIVVKDCLEKDFPQTVQLESRNSENTPIRPKERVEIKIKPCSSDTTMQISDSFSNIVKENLLKEMNHTKSNYLPAEEKITEKNRQLSTSSLKSELKNNCKSHKRLKKKRNKCKPIRVHKSYSPGQHRKLEQTTVFVHDTLKVPEMNPRISKSKNSNRQVMSHKTEIINLLNSAQRSYSTTTIGSSSTAEVNFLSKEISKLDNTDEVIHALQGDIRGMCSFNSYQDITNKPVKRRRPRRIGTGYNSRGEQLQKLEVALSNSIPFLQGPTKSGTVDERISSSCTACNPSLHGNEGLNVSTRPRLLSTDEGRKLRLLYTNPHMTIKR